MITAAVRMHDPEISHLARLPPKRRLSRMAILYSLTIAAVEYAEFHFIHHSTHRYLVQQIKFFGMGAARRAYMFLYNATLCVGWAYVLYLTVKADADRKDKQRMWQEVELPLKVVQTAAVMEVLHSMVGLVRSPVSITAIQVASRLWILWGVVNLAPGPTTTGTVNLLEYGVGRLQLSLFTLLTAWSLSEIIRYSFFASKELGLRLYPLLWLRYTAFIVLYPLGVSSELSMVWLALPTIIRERLLYLELPNPLNFGVNYAVLCCLSVLSYLPGFPKMYLYMLSQRRKQLGGGSAAGHGKVKAY